MAKILSIEVGCSVTRVCEIDYKTKNPKIYKYASLPTPEGIVDDGFLNLSEEFVRELKKLLIERKMKTKQVIFSVTSSRIANREIFLPMVKMGQVEALVKANATEYFPIDLSDYEVAALVLGVKKEEGQADRYRVMVMAAEKKLLNGYEQLAEGLGLNLMALDYSGNSLYQVMRNECKEETEMVIKVEEFSTIVTIIREQNLVLQRNLLYGVEDAIRTLMQQRVFETDSYIDARRLMIRKTCIRNVISENTRVLDAEDSDDWAEENENIARAKTEVTASLTPLVSNIQRVVDLYNSKNVDTPVRKIRLVGLGSDISGLSKLLTNELGIPTIVMTGLSSVTWNRGDGENNPGRYIAGIGASIAPVGFINEEKKKSDIKSVNYRNMSVLLGIFFTVLSASFVIIGFLGYQEEKEEQERLTELQTLYEPAEKVYQTYNSMVSFYKEVENGYLQTVHPNENLLAFLQELEEKLPADAEVTDFTSNNEQAVLSMKVADKEEAAKVIQTLRDFDSIMDVSIGAVDKEEVEDQAEEEEEEDYRVLFSIVCTYYPSITEDGAAAQDVAATAE